MSSSILLPTRFSLIAALVVWANTIGDVLSEAYSRPDDIEHFGL